MGGRSTTEFSELERALEWRFSNRDLLREALTHSSARVHRSNERLEFLGDRVLGLVIAESLVEAFPGEDEGALAPRLNALVRKETCAEIAREIDLGSYLTLARSEALSGGRRKTAMLGDAMEAVLAAVYLDGGIEAARVTIACHWKERLHNLNETPIDPKTALQEWAQSRGMDLPHYRTVDRTGPDHAPTFTIEVAVDKTHTGRATASSKRSAERGAAQALLDALDLTKSGSQV